MLVSRYAKSYYITTARENGRYETVVVSFLAKLRGRNVAACKLDEQELLIVNFRLVNTFPHHLMRRGWCCW